MLYSCSHGADYQSVVSLGSTCTLLRSVTDAEAIWRGLLKRDFEAAAALFQPPDKKEDVSATEEAESMEQRWAFCRYKAVKHICRILAVLLSSFISFVVSLTIFDFRFDMFDMGSIKN